MTTIRFYDTLIIGARGSGKTSVSVSNSASGIHMSPMYGCSSSIFQATRDGESKTICSRAPLLSHAPKLCSCQTAPLPRLSTRLALTIPKDRELRSSDNWPPLREDGTVTLLYPANTCLIPDPDVLIVVSNITNPVYNLTISTGQLSYLTAATLAFRHFSEVTIVAAHCSTHSE